MSTNERPILFNAAMVQAILDGRKDQTRRPIRIRRDMLSMVDDPTARWSYTISSSERKWRDKWSLGVEDPDGGTFSDRRERVARAITPPARAEDLLWVREPTEYRGALPIARKMEVRYVADGTVSVVDWPERIKRPKAFGHRLANGCYKEAARIWLRVAEVRVERVQDITREGAASEGMGRRCSTNHGLTDPPGACTDCGNTGFDYPPDLDFMETWQDIYGTWDANPWVWVTRFEVVSTTGRPK